MKYITFYRENNDFTDILKDPGIKKSIDEITSWKNYLLLGVVDDDRVMSYITLKYGDNIRTNLITDYTPVPYVDYTPIRK